MSNQKLGSFGVIVSPCFLRNPISACGPQYFKSDSLSFSVLLQFVLVFLLICKSILELYLVSRKIELRNGRQSREGSSKVSSALDWRD